MIGFLGEFEATLDTKGRFLLPAGFKNGTIRDKQFYNLPELLPPSSFLALNDSRVIEARIQFQKDPVGHIII